MKRLMAMAAAVAMMAGTAQGALIITALYQDYSGDFEGWDGSGDPEYFTLSNYDWHGYCNLDGSYLHFNRAYAFRENETGETLGWGVRRAASGIPIFNMSLQNDTGEEITELHIDFTIAQYAEAGRASEIYFNNYRVGTESWTTAGVTRDDAYVATATDPEVQSNLWPILTEAQSATIAFPTALQPGQAFEIGWRVDHGDGPGSNAHVGFTDWSVTAIPEPATFGLLLGAGGLLAALRRRRRDFWAHSTFCGDLSWEPVGRDHRAGCARGGPFGFRFALAPIVPNAYPSLAVPEGMGFGSGGEMADTLA